MTEKKILAVDVGFGNTKVVWGESTRSEICFKSVAPKTSLNQNALVGLSSSALERVRIDVGAESYLVGPEAYQAGGSHHLDPNYVHRNEYLALLRGAIFYMFAREGAVPRDIDVLVLGLPVSGFFVHKDALTKIAKFEHPIPIPNEARAMSGSSIMVSAKSVLIVPQPMGALRLGSSLNGANLNTVNLVIDPGYNTFDWLISKGFQPDLARSGSFQGGVSQVLREVSNAAGMALGVGQIDLIECEEALETGELRVNGRKIPFTQFNQVAETAAAEVVDRFINGLDTRRRFDNIILTGGGAKFYAAALRARLPDYSIVVGQDSVMQNARGFYRIANDLLG